MRQQRSNISSSACMLACSQWMYVSDRGPLWVQTIELFYECCTELFALWTHLTVPALGKMPSQLTLKTYLHLPISRTDLSPSIGTQTHFCASSPYRHTQTHISVPGALALVILYLSLFLRYAKEMLEDKQCTSLRHCSQEKSHQGTQRLIPQSPPLMPACNALVGREQQFFNVTCCKAERLFVIRGTLKESILWLKRFLDI